MQTKLLTRVAAFLMVFHAFAHNIGMSQWKIAKNPEQQAVISGMTDHRFPFMGAVHSFGDSFTGFGAVATIFMLLVAFLLWHTGGFAAAQPGISKKFLFLLFLSLAATCIVEFIYFFPFAAIITLLAAVLTGVAAIGLRNAKA